MVGGKGKQLTGSDIKRSKTVRKTAVKKACGGELWTFAKAGLEEGGTIVTWPTWTNWEKGQRPGVKEGLNELEKVL